MGIVSWQKLQKCPKLTFQVTEDDTFSRLPDEIIVSHILPRLTSEEAVRSSILSRRWKNLWIHGIGNKLVFSHTRDRYFNPSVVGQHIIGLRGTFASGINRVLEAYPKPTLDELVVRFDFDSSSSDTIDSWLEYAFRKGVTRLELDLSPGNVCFGKAYAFPSLQKLSDLHALCDSNLHEPVRCAGVHNLKEVCLNYVNVSSEVIDFMLSNCPSLERLSVSRSVFRKRIKVSGQSVKLKSLEVVRCFDTKIKISSSNLVSLQYSGHAKALCIKHAPFLSELSIGRGYCKAFLRTGSQNFSYIAQLRKLTLDMSLKVVVESLCYPLEFPELVKLEQLEVKVMAHGDSCILWPIVLIKAAPMLHRFSVQFFILESMKPMKRLQEHVRNLCNATKLVRHQCLKLIEIHDFSGNPCELELGEHLLGISQSLQHVVVAPLFPYRRGKPHPLDDDDSFMQNFRKRAKQLTSWLPLGANLMVL